MKKSLKPNLRISGLKIKRDEIVPSVISAAKRTLHSLFCQKREYRTPKLRTKINGDHFSKDSERFFVIVAARIDTSLVGTT